MNFQFEVLKKHLARFTDIPLGEWPHFVTKVRFKKVKKGEHLWVMGGIYQYLGIVLSGNGFVYFQKEDGSKKIRRFMTSGSPVGSLLSVLDGKESRDAFVALDNMLVAQIKYSDLEELGRRHACWERLMRRGFEEDIRMREAREIELTVESPKDIYESVYKKYPFIEGQVPQYLVASYIGITPEALSRIRAQRVE